MNYVCICPGLVLIIVSVVLPVGGSLFPMVRGGVLVMGFFFVPISIVVVLRRFR